MSAYPVNLCLGLTRSRYTLLLAGLFFASIAWADTTMIAVADATKGASNAAVTMLFPVSRAGDTSFDAVLNYHTVDGSAMSQFDYLASSGSVVIPAGATSAQIPVSLVANTANAADSSFQLVFDGVTGYGAAPSFSAHAEFGSVSQPYAFAVGDLNGDGKPDLVAIDNQLNRVSVMLNTSAAGVASASFSAPANFTTGQAPFGVVLGDLNGDGKLDMIITNYVDSTISVFLNTTVPGAATPTFATAQTLAAGTGPTLIVLADVNGDGRLDVIVSNLNAIAAVLLNTTSPGASAVSFATRKNLTIPGEALSIAAADVNADGRPDLVVATGSQTIGVLLNSTPAGATTASFAASIAFSAATFAQSVAIADVNGDGRPDLLVADYNGNAAQVLLNKTIPGGVFLDFSAPQMFAAGNHPHAIAIADVNGDGKPDLIVANAGDNSMSILINRTVPGAAQSNFSARANFAAGTQPFAIVTADFNGDGKPDLASVNFTSGNVSVLLNTTLLDATAVNFTAAVQTPVGTGPRSVVSADLNGDGQPDLLVSNQGDSTVMALLNTTPLGGISPVFAVQVLTIRSHPTAIATADINGDGKPDVIAGLVNATTNAIAVQLNTTATGATSATFAAQHTFATDLDPGAIAIADINGDGKPDVIAANYISHTVSVLLNTTATGASIPSFTLQKSFATGAAPIALAVADVNGDGRPDIVVANLVDNNVSVLLNTTTPGATLPSFAAQQTFGTDIGPVSLAIGDINGDGKPDLVVVEVTHNEVSVLLNTSVTGATIMTFAAAQNFMTANAPAQVTLADLDGDGRLDLIVADTGGTSVFFNKTAVGATTASFAARQSFSSGATAAGIYAGDLNGDGKADLVTASATANTISMLFNTQYRASLAAAAATGTIVHDLIFANAFE